MTTIFAPASGQGRAAVAVLRISGPETGQVLSGLIGQLPPPRRASVRALRGADGTLLDRALVLWMPGPASYTGEDCAELQVHGGRAVMHGVIDALVEVGARLAEPGEFTRRSFIHGKMDLLEAEGVADLVDADTDAQRTQALEQLGGAHSALLMGWAERLQRLLAWQEALIDFPDEGLPDGVEARLVEEVADLARILADAAVAARRGARVRDGIVVAVVGPPNVGKSSLVNRLAERDVAITSPLPGTTRDVLEARLVLAGVAVTLIDTAGLRETDDPVEAEGVRRARERAASADIVMFVVDASSGAVDAAGENAVKVANKVDRSPAPPGWLGVSALTEVGLPELRRALIDQVRCLTDTGANPVLSRARHEAALREAARYLDQAGGAIMPELRGESLRLAMRALGTITGKVDVEDILGAIFSTFCIGK